eukprot:Opistho-1_new@98565
MPRAPQRQPQPPAFSAAPKPQRRVRSGYGWPRAASAGRHTRGPASGKQRLVLLTQQILLHLPHRVARQLGHHKTLLGNLEVGQLRLELRHDGIGVELRTGLGNHHGHAHFAKVGVGHAHQGAFGHAGHLIDVALDLGRVDVVAAADDQVLAAAHDAHVVALVHFAHITGFEPAVGREFFGGLFGHAPVALEHVGALHLDAADLAHGQRLVGIVHHAQAHAGQREAHRGAAPLALAAVACIGRIGVAGEHDGFAHAVALQDGVACALLPFGKGLDQQRGRPCDEQAHVLGGILGHPCTLR